MGNGAKASMKRDRNQKDAKVAKSQTKSTTKAPACVTSTLRDLILDWALRANILAMYSLLEHASNKHKKGSAECFPGVSA
ncbi:hypothetical protein NUU61_004454 [Penicillium alfredii]|uniref:Small EDRK-rich factor-like N-terminal domain-containing protein n=1 Tax=Penicillium alfredii TaxID=1506179 RepID=A0A9W9FLK9_9EURO|nr:uncharacterized protein NUU61_004454 [Penicillium alfredii]KAJ5102232.1 hypothetical protein NUU61_004454 [Penicillium alfredii]